MLYHYDILHSFCNKIMLMYILHCSEWSILPACNQNQWLKLNLSCTCSDMGVKYLVSGCSVESLDHYLKIEAKSESCGAGCTLWGFFKMWTCYSAPIEFSRCGHCRRNVTLKAGGIKAELRSWNGLWYSQAVAQTESLRRATNQESESNLLLNFTSVLI